MDWNKDHIRETMLSLETAALQSARDKYLDYVSTARLDRSESIENDEQAQAEIASDFAEALDDTLDDYADKLDKLRVRPGTHDARAMRRIRTMAAAA